MKAFRESGAIPDEWYDNMQQAFFQRASRTDKGVSAAKMIVSLKLREFDIFDVYFCSIALALNVRLKKNTGK